MSADQAILEARGVRHAFGGVQAVNDTSFTIRQGEFVGLIGPNGAGKTTLLDCLSGRIRNYRGQVLFEGTDITKRPLDAVARAGLIRSFQVSRVFNRLTLFANLMVASQGQKGEKLRWALTGRWRDEEEQIQARVIQIIEEFRLAPLADAYASEASGGQRRLIELARLILAEPKMLLLDEPFAGVSPANRKSLAEWLSFINKEKGLSVLMVEHRLEQVERLCSTAIVMANGRPIARDAMSALRQDRAVVDAYFGGATE
ncbi:MAG: ABC transporter ATP-binding protein [Acidimicrobiales bacterium]